MMNRRQFLRTIIPVAGAVAVAPSILIPEKKFWDMGAAWAKTLQPGDVGYELANGAIDIIYNAASHLWEVSWVEKGGYPMRRFDTDGKEIQVADVTLTLPSRPSHGDKITAVYKRDLTHNRVSIHQENT